MNQHDQGLAPEVRDVLHDAYDDEVGPVPDHLDRFAKAAFGWRNVDAELARVVFDSAVDQPVGVRGAGTDRRSFRYSALGVEMHVSLTDASIVVMVDHDGELDVRIFSGAGGDESVSAWRTDEFGELTAAAPELPVRIEVDLPAGTAATPWIIG